MKLPIVLLTACTAALHLLRGQSVDWQSVVWREPQVRYLLADLSLGGSPELYRKYASEERDPDSREALRLWDAGVRVVNVGDFERKWLSHPAGKDGKILRIVQRGSSRTILGDEERLTSDGSFQQSAMRLALLDLTLGASPSSYEAKQADAAIAEALRRWREGARVTNPGWFEAKGDGAARRLVWSGSDLAADGARVTLNSDVPWPEVNVRYFMADIALGGSIEFYRKAAEAAHEMGCLEAVRRTEQGVTIANRADFERKQVGGKALITRQGSDARISGSLVKLSTDQ